MKHFLNQELMAPNVLKVAVDAVLIQQRLAGLIGHYDPAKFAISRPSWDSDIRWISARSVEAFNEFQSLFDSLGIARLIGPYLDLDHVVRLYSGFLVERSCCEKPNFHFDWSGTNNEAFTLLTPVTGNSAGFGMLYRKLDGSVGEYDYKLGEALIIGDHFSHSTMPGRSAEPVILLSFTFGTDKMSHWGKIAKTAAHQGGLVQLPNGTFQEAEC